MEVERIWRPELARFCTVEMKQWERIVRHRAGLRKVPDIHGRTVYTDDQLFNYAEQFQSDFLGSQTRVIHAGEGGMRLAGTEVLTLHAAAGQFCTRALPGDLFALPPQEPPAELRRSALAQLERRIEEVRQVRRISAETVELLEQLDGLVERPAEFNRRVARIDELHARVQKQDRTYHLISQVSQLAELRRVHADRAIRENGRETPESTRRRLRRDREYVSAFIEGCDYLLELLPESHRRVREWTP
jgi:hypothetical protein